jgi:hypothetical protein
MMTTPKGNNSFSMSVPEGVVGSEVFPENANEEMVVDPF